MKGVSGFTFVHDGLDSGYPFIEAIQAVRSHVDEVVAVDMQSTDHTRRVLENLGCRVIDGVWEPGAGGACLEKNHALHEECEGDIIWHFEADEVFSKSLAEMIWDVLHDGPLSAAGRGVCDLAVQRIQVVENFQRVRWYPEWVHRIFRKGSVKKKGHTTNRHEEATKLPICHGILWDCPVTNRDNWIPRMYKQAELWGHHEPKFLTTPHHVLGGNHYITEEAAREYIKQPHWLWSATPFNMPPLLMRQVGRVQYEH